MKANARFPLITVLGAGQIGFAIALLLQRTGEFGLRVIDRDAKALERIRALGCDTAVVGDDDADLAPLLQGSHAVLNALPFHRAVPVAALCVRAKIHYFDLTEDVASTQAIQAMGRDAQTVLMPQCGLAPGFIGIVGHQLATRFDELHDLRMRVGALPRYPSNALRYNLTWSTEGLINEYCKPCEAIVDGKLAEVAPLEGLETFSLDGIEYEAFNTSGGLGTLTRTLLGKARNVDYKSVRYPGHGAVMKLLLNDLRLKEQPALLKQIFEHAIPSTQQDVVVVHVSASGLRDGRLTQESYASRTTSAVIDGHRLSAIQITTAAGICAAFDLMHAGVLHDRGFLGQECITAEAFLNNRFGQFYRGLAVSSEAWSMVG